MSLPPAPDPVPAAPFRSEPRPPPVSIEGISRVVGYGLLAMFALDLPPIASAYVQRPLDAQMDATLVSQILERIAVPLIAFALIFGWEVHDLPRWERALRKLLSQLMLVASLGSLGLSALAVTSGIRQYNHAALLVDLRANQRGGALTQLGKQLPALNGEALRATYVSVIKPDAARPLPAPAQMKQEIAAALPGAIDANYATARANKEQGRWNEWLAVGKYAIDGVVAAALFFLLWEASAPARLYRIFREKNAPSLGVESAMIDGIASVGRKIEQIRIFPNFEDYAWIRRLRRKWRHRKDHKHR